MCRIIELTAKENAIEDCMAAIKKAYEKDMMPLSEFISVRYILCVICDDVIVNKETIQ